MSLFDLQKNGTFDPKEVVANFRKGLYPDALYFAEKGDTLIKNSGVIRITRGGSQELITSNY
jgi:hypothetical protein